MFTTNRFDYVAYDQEAAAKQAQMKDKFVELTSLIEANLYGGRAKALVLTKLEEAYMWIGKAIRDEQVDKRGATLQENRGNE